MIWTEERRRKLGRAMKKAHAKRKAALAGIEGGRSLDNPLPLDDPKPKRKIGRPRVKLTKELEPSHGTWSIKTGSNGFLHIHHPERGEFKVRGINITHRDAVIIRFATNFPFMLDLGQEQYLALTENDARQLAKEFAKIIPSMPR